MRVKICGVTRAEDAALAADLGAWAVGFVFWPRSPRFIEPGAAAGLLRTVRPRAVSVGVFVDQALSDVVSVASVVGLDFVQLHGDEDARYAAGVGRGVIKAVSPSDGAALGWPPDVLLLADAINPAARGGTGTRTDWSAAAQLSARRPMILAGGLTPENVADAIRVVRPFAVDVSSGVESSPGVKDARRMSALFAAVSAAGGERT